MTMFNSKPRPQRVTHNENIESINIQLRIHNRSNDACACSHPFNNVVLKCLFNRVDAVESSSFVFHSNPAKLILIAKSEYSEESGVYSLTSKVCLPVNEIVPNGPGHIW